MHPDQMAEYARPEKAQIKEASATEALDSQIEVNEQLCKQLEEQLTNALRSPFPVEGPEPMPEVVSPIRSLAQRLADNNARIRHLIDRIDV